MNEVIEHTPNDAAEPPVPAIDIQQVKLVLEAALLSAPEPLTVLQLKRLFAGEIDVDNLRKVLDEMKGEWQDRAIELTSVASGWRFRVKSIATCHNGQVPETVACQCFSDKNEAIGAGRDPAPGDARG